MIININGDATYSNYDDDTAEHNKFVRSNNYILDPNNNKNEYRREFNDTNNRNLNEF
jgi:hypothetical protein